MQIGREFVVSLPARHKVLIDGFPSLCLSLCLLIRYPIPPQFHLLFPIVAMSTILWILVAIAASYILLRKYINAWIDKRRQLSLLQNVCRAAQ